MSFSGARHLSLTLGVFAAFVAISPQAATPASKRLVSASRLEAQVAKRVNLVRRWHGLRPLGVSQGLTTAARRHSREMGRQGYFQHDSLSGTAFWRRIERSYGSHGFQRWEVGENIAWNTSRASAADIVRQWMRSPTHRANMLSQSWRELGLGAFRVSRASGAYRGRSVTIVTLDLGIRAR